MKTWLTIVFLFFLRTGLVCGQKDSLFIDPRAWSELTEDADYTETYQELKPRVNGPKIHTPRSQNPVVKYVVYGLLLTLLVFLIARVLNNFTKNTTTPRETPVIEDLEEIEEKIHELDLEQMRNDALAAGNYKLVLRLNFLIIIKLLSENGFIQWTKDKTNWDYYHELKNKMLADHYKALTRDFEIYWYGERPFSETEYRRSTPLYDNIRKHIVKHE